VVANNYHEEEALGKAYDARLMKRLLTYLRPYRAAVVAAAIMLLAVSLLQVAVPHLIKIAIDDYIGPKDLDGLTNITLLFAAVLVAGAAVRYAQTYLMIWLGQKVLHDIRRQVFAHLQRMNLAFYDKNPVGRLVTRVTSDVNTLNDQHPQRNIFFWRGRNYRRSLHTGSDCRRPAALQLAAGSDHFCRGAPVSGGDVCISGESP